MRLCFRRRSQRTRNGFLSRTGEIAFYVSSKPVTASRAAQAIRAHWAIETTSHFSRDVTLSEDRSQTPDRFVEKM